MQQVKCNVLLSLLIALNHVVPVMKTLLYKQGHETCTCTIQYDQCLPCEACDNEYKYDHSIIFYLSNTIQMEKYKTMQNLI